MYKKIIVKNKKELTSITKKYRSMGYMLITYGFKMVELEKDDVLISVFIE